MLDIKCPICQHQHACFCFQCYMQHNITNIFLKVVIVILLSLNLINYEPYVFYSVANISWIGGHWQHVIWHSWIFSSMELWYSVFSFPCKILRLDILYKTKKFRDQSRNRVFHTLLLNYLKKNQNENSTEFYTYYFFGIYHLLSLFSLLLWAF